MLDYTCNYVWLQWLLNCAYWTVCSIFSDNLGPTGLSVFFLSLPNPKRLTWTGHRAFTSATALIEKRGAALNSVPYSLAISTLHRAKVCPRAFTVNGWIQMRRLPHICKLVDLSGTLLGNHDYPNLQLKVAQSPMSKSVSLGVGNNHIPIFRGHSLDMHERDYLCPTAIVSLQLS